MKSALQAPHKQAPASYWTYLYARSHDASAGGGGVVLSSDGVGSSRSACPDFAAVTLALGLRGRPQHWRPDVLLYRRLRPVGALGQLRRGRVIHLLRRIQRTGTPCSCMTSPPWDRWAIGSALAAGLIALYLPPGARCGLSSPSTWPIRCSHRSRPNGGQASSERPTLRARGGDDTDPPVQGCTRHDRVAVPGARGGWRRGRRDLRGMAARPRRDRDDDGPCPPGRLSLGAA